MHEQISNDLIEVANKFPDLTVSISIKDLMAANRSLINEKNNPHCHIVWNRVDENGRRYNDSNERKRSVQVFKGSKC